MFQPWRKPDDVTGPDLLDRAALALHPTEPSGDDQRLTERVRVPGRAGAGLERDLASTDAGGIRSLE
jgi:hypothetical protein